MLDSDEPPTAVLCANGYVVAAAAKDLVALGKDGPTAIALAGMDDAGHPRPPHAVRATAALLIS